MVAPKEIIDLTQAFEFHREAYRKGQYNETQLRQEFMDPLFRALGWDLDNKSGADSRDLEVIHDDPIKIQGTMKYIDYSFRLGGGTRIFFVETKKPSVRIKDDAISAFQLRKYGWNAKLPLSILTNFDEFAVYDCTRKPLNGDAASVGRVEYFTYDKYPEKWDWIASVFSKDSVILGSFDKFVESKKGKKPEHIDVP